MLANQITHIAFLAKQVIRCRISLGIKAIYQGPKNWGGGGVEGGGAWGVSGRSIGALKILPRSPEPGALEKFAAKPGVPNTSIQTR